MKLSDYVVEFLVQHHIHHVFLISGGAVIHLVDSVARHPKMMYICPQHEQGGGAAADMYARVTRNFGVTMTTSGPGTTNLVTSVCNAYFDSIPTLFLSGQVATFRLKRNESLRQKGFQETDVVSIFKSITKYATLVEDPQDIRYELEKAVYLAKSGRPGPVLLDIPDDLQRVDVDPDKLRSFVPEPTSVKSPAQNRLVEDVKKIVSFICEAKRPVLILGAGIRIAKAQQAAIAFARHFHLPVLLTWGGMDLLPHDDMLNMGGVGVCGPRAGNFAAQNSDLVIAIGTRLSQMITGGKQNLFAPQAKKVMVDIDPEELNKFNKDTFILDVAIESEIGVFFNAWHSLQRETIADQFGSWRKQIKTWADKYPICLPEYFNRKDRVNAYVFITELSELAKEGDIIITDAGGNLSWTMQAFKIKKGQQIYSAWNHSPMGYSLPASIGAAVADNKEVLCIIGDGGLMMCIEELATVKRYQLPVKLFIFNNRGHGIQKQTIDTWLNSHYVAVDEKTGLSFPNFLKIGDAFGLPSLTIQNHAELKSKLKEILQHKGPVLCNVDIVDDQKIVPMLKFGAGLEDLDPKIPAEELKIIMETALK